MIWTAYGPPEVLQLQEIEKPKLKDNQVLVKVVVSNIFAGDCELKLVAEGRIRPVIEKNYPLHQIIEAHHYMDTFERIGNVVLQVQASS